MKNETHYCYGSGQPGCLYDYGPHFASTRDAAIDGVMFVLDNQLSPRSLARVRRDLGQHGIHYLDRRLRPLLGVSYLEISECNGPCPEDEES